MKDNPKQEKFGSEPPKFKIVQTGEFIDFETLQKIVGCYQERLKKLSEIPELTDFFFKEKLEYPKELLRWKNQTDDDLLKTLDKVEEILSKIEEAQWNKENLEKILTTAAEKWGRTDPGRIKDRGYLLWPLRAAITGKKASASPFEIAEILGKEKTLKRIKEAKEIVAENPKTI